MERGSRSTRSIEDEVTGSAKYGLWVCGSMVFGPACSFFVQQFYEFLASKARPKPWSPTWSSSPPEEEISQRIEARLNAVEQKRFTVTFASPRKQKVEQCSV